MNSCCLLELYLDGDLYGWTINSLDGYKSGLAFYNKDLGDIFVGVCPWLITGQLYYHKGDIYSLRLYNRSINSEDVKNNYEKTLKYRESF